MYSRHYMWKMSQRQTSTKDFTKLSVINIKWASLASNTELYVQQNQPSYFITYSGQNGKILYDHIRIEKQNNIPPDMARDDTVQSKNREKNKWKRARVYIKACTEKTCNLSYT